MKRKGFFNRRWTQMDADGKRDKMG